MSIIGRILGTDKQQSKVQELEKQLADMQVQLDGKKRGKQSETKGYEPQETLFRWTAPSRIFIPRDKNWFIKIAAIMMFFILILAFLQEIVLIIVLCAFLFVIYVLSTIPPQKVAHEITNKGIKTMEKLYYWKDLKNFWLSEKSKHLILNVDTKLKFPARLIMIIRQEDKGTIVKLLGDYLDYLEITSQGWLARISDGVYIPPEELGMYFQRGSDTQEADQSQSRPIQPQQAAPSPLQQKPPARPRRR